MLSNILFVSMLKCSFSFLQLLDILAEAYQTTFDHMERQNIAQVCLFIIIDLFLVYLMFFFLS